MCFLHNNIYDTRPCEMKCIYLLLIIIYAKLLCSILSNTVLVGFFAEKFHMRVETFSTFLEVETRPRQLGNPFKADGYQSSDGAHPLPKGHHHDNTKCDNRHHHHHHKHNCTIN